MEAEDWSGAREKFRQINFHDSENLKSVAYYYLIIKKIA